MNLSFGIINIFISVLSILLGSFAFIKNRNNPVNYFWFLASLSICVWSAAYAGVVLSQNYGDANTWQYLLDFTAVWVPIFYFNFVLSVIGQKRTWIRVASFVLGGLVSLLSLTPLFRNGMVSVFTFEYWVNPGPLYLLSPLVYTIFVFASLYLLLTSIRKSRGRKKLQLRYILLAGLVGFGGATTNYFPQLFNTYPFGNYFLGFYVVFITYSIVKHRLMDIRMVVARSVTYIILLVILAAFYAGSVLGIERYIFPTEANNFSLAQGALRTAISVAMVFLFQPLRRWITKITDNIFFKNSYDKDELLSRLSNTLGSTIVLIEMLYKVSNLLTEEMKASRTLFALIKDENRLYTVQANGYKSTPEVEPRDIQHITRDGIMIADELADNSAHKRMLREYDAAIAIPLKTEKEVVGVLFLGEKSSGDMYSQQDLAVLEIIAPEIAVAIENAKSYEEINRFNVTLRQEVKRATSRLKLKNEQLMELDKAKDEFISMASHQLRTPLTAIKGYLSMLLEGDAGDIKVSQYDFINEAYSGANRMVGLINDLLNVSRMETGRFFLEPKELDIERVVEEEVKQLTNAAKAKNLTLTIERKGKVPHIWADETKIRQVVMNFMDNAIYYTNTGGVTVVLKHDKNDFIYEVHDTGIGVPRAQLEHLFEKFFRADNARTARPDGTGLGIYLAKRVVEDHGGEIIFDSVEGKGSMFGFRFPLKKKPVAVQASAPEPKAVVPTPTMPMATEIAEKSTSE
jgi:signal transduction histidine kinase